MQSRRHIIELRIVESFKSPKRYQFEVSTSIAANELIGHVKEIHREIDSEEFELHLAKVISQEDTPEQSIELNDGDKLYLICQRRDLVRNIPVPSFPEHLVDAQQWWNRIKTEEYPLYGILLLDSVNREAALFFGKYLESLDLLTGRYCGLLIFYNSFEKTSEGWLAQPLSPQEKARQHTEQSYRVADYFDIPTSELPCVVFFEDLLGEDPVRISFKGMESDDIFEEMRQIRDVIRKAQKKGHNPLEALARHQKAESVRGWNKKAQENLGVVGQTVAKILIEDLLRQIEEGDEMVDIATIAAAISAATAAVGLFDKISDQVERFITESPEPSVPRQHRMTIEESDGAIVSRSHGQELKRITADDLQNLPESELRHISVLEKSMENHYRIWEKVYPELALVDGLVQKAKVEQQLENVIRDMGKDLEGILSFLESCGLQLDDHYMNVRHLIGQV